MHMVYNAKDLHDAQGIRDLLANSGILAHLADPSREIGPTAAGSIRVSVDNDRLDAARRVIAAESRARRHRL